MMDEKEKEIFKILAEALLALKLQVRQLEGIVKKLKTERVRNG